jgi:diguanylate cyclase (GGDEF)-like protein/PAS domain S-box-containing protein
MATTADCAAAILVVDDNRGKRLAINAVLESLGHPRVEAESGEAALHAVMRQTFAVILMDVRMPGMDGYETASLIRMRRQSEHTPIIFITAHEKDETQVSAAYASGAVDFIFAPIVPDILRAKVSIFIELFLKSGALEQSLSDATTLSNQFRDNEARTRAVLDNVADGIVTMGEDGVIESFNRAASSLFGRTEDDARGKQFGVLVASKDLDKVGGRAEVSREIARQQRRNGSPAELTGLRKDGSTFPMELVLSDVQLGTRKIDIACVRDISEREIYTATLQHQALHDALTDLPNRVLFGDRVNHAIRAGSRGETPLALLVMDLDEFKEVNDTLGHQHGDVLLQLVAKRLVGCLREGDTVARLGGDEFGILPLGATDVAGAASVAWKLLRALEPPFSVNGHSIVVKASIGIALVPDHGDNIDDVLRRADLAMYDAKRAGTGFALFAVEQEQAPARRLALLRDLRRCVENDELVLHYQPQVDLATGETIGLEALIRWQHPSGQLVMPDDFIPEVERSELMGPITEWVINEALRMLRRLRDEGYDLTMAVNIAGRCLSAETNLFETIEQLTDSWGIPPNKLTCEITEGALIDTAIPSLVTRLKDMAARLSIDDFGTGYSSLVYLQRLPVVEIKADRSFVTGLMSVKEDAVIVRSTIELAHSLSLRIVAEGVEDEATMNLLVSYGCDVAQGYCFSRPIPGEELLEWLATSQFGLPRRLERKPAAVSAARSDRA